MSCVNTTIGMHAAHFKTERKTVQKMLRVNNAVRKSQHFLPIISPLSVFLLQTVVEVMLVYQASKFQSLQSLKLIRA